MVQILSIKYGFFDMKTGVVKNYIPATRYGFITDDDGSGDIFVHLNQLKENGLMN